jgi:hypothetical protein
MASTASRERRKVAEARHLIQVLRKAIGSGREGESRILCDAGGLWVDK